jgi:hypothetical protein
VLLSRTPASGNLQGAIKQSIKRRFPVFVREAQRIRSGLHKYSARSRGQKDPAGVPSAARPGSLSSVLREPYLVIGDDLVRQASVDHFGARDCLMLGGGGGATRSLPVPQSGEPPLRSAAPDSLAAWLIDDPTQLRRMATIVMDAGDELSLGMLRGRLVKGQSIVLVWAVHGERATGPLVTALGAPSVEEATFRVYSEVPVAWLDPLDEKGHSVSASVGLVNWPKISVVMVSYNQASFVEESIQSVLGQGYPNLEFIIVDGNSTDGSIEIVNRYRDRVAKLIIEPDLGQSDGLNKGFSKTTGEILTWVNSDDLLELGALFRVAQAFSFYGTDMVAGGCRQIGLTRDIVITNHHNRLPYGIPVALPLGLLLEMDRFWLTGNFFYQPEVFFSRRIWESSGGRLRTDLNYVLDYDLWVRMAAAGATVVHIPDFLACSRTHDQQKTTVGMPQMPEVQWLLRDYSKRFLRPPLESVAPKP